MKMLILSLSVLIGFHIHAQFTLIPDANFESALISLGHDALPLDGQVPTANICSLTLLDVSGKNIADLTGIEDFVAVENLDLGSNALTTLDLSQNVNLEVIYILYNPLICVNLQNGNNENIELLAAFQCPDLTCIQVDDALYSDTNWVDDPNTPAVEYILDPQVIFSEYCEYCNLSFAPIYKGYYTISPNPTSDYIQFDELNEKLVVSIYNSSGQLILPEIQLEGSQKIDVQSIKSQILLVKIVEDDGVFWRKVFKQ